MMLVTERYKNVLDWFYDVRDKKIEINLSESLFINGDVV